MMPAVAVSKEWVEDKYVRRRGPERKYSLMDDVVERERFSV